MVPILDVCQALGVDRFVDGHLAEHAGALIEYGGLTGRDALDSLVEFDLPHDIGFAIYVTGRDASTAGYRFSVSANLDVAVKPCTGGFFSKWSASPGGANTGDTVNGEHVTCSNDDGIFFRTDFEHEAWFAVLSRFTNAESATLPDRKGLGAGVGADFLTFGIDDRAVSHVNLFFQPAAGIAVGDKADIVRVGFLSNRQATFSGLGADHLFRRGIPQREHRVLELFGRQHAQHIGLVFGIIGGTVQLEFAVVVFDHFGIVSGNDGVETKRQCAFQQRGEFDAFIAAHAGVWGATGGVFVNKVFNDFFLESFGEVPGVVGNTEFFAGTPGIRGVFNRAASARSGAEGAGHAG